jgi:asparagine synthetase B (glutamine-hydrolysing)
MIATRLCFNPKALSEYLALRWLARPETAWVGAYRPDRSTITPTAQIPVATADDVIDALSERLRDLPAGATGLLLSGGIDSAILARLLPRGLPAYTIRFDAPGAIDESRGAAAFAAAAGLDHHIVTVGWQDYMTATDVLMMRKRAPLHPVEIGLYKAALRANADGLTTLVVGNGADSTFGGLDRLLSRDWTFDAFVERYTFLEPARVLADPADVCAVFEAWRRADRFDTAGFLKTVHGEGVTQAFLNAVNAAGCEMRAPYEDLVLQGPLDLVRIRAGNSKYVLREAFARLYGSMPAPEKIAFARPLDVWLADWAGPTRPEFRPDVDMAALTGEQRWLVWCLERFLGLMERLHD